MTGEPRGAAILEAVLSVLSEEEEQLARLLGLALEEQQALVTSNVDGLEEINTRMVELAAGLDVLEHRRVTLLGEFNEEVETLSELVPVAQELGVDGFGAARERLVDAAVRLQQAQESNARLIMAAMRMGERWMNLAAGMTSPTYGAAGNRRTGRSNGLMSRSA
jgi:flagellar biosynthesis/type III secretory pathway chaperone